MKIFYNGKEQDCVGDIVLKDGTYIGSPEPISLGESEVRPHEQILGDILLAKKLEAMAKIHSDSSPYYVVGPIKLVGEEQ